MAEDEVAMLIDRTSSPLSARPVVEEKQGFCALCVSQCGALFKIENGFLTEVKPLLDHPTGGALCRKGRAAPEMINDPSRILTPLKRTNPKGSEDPGWVSIGWDEALDEVAERLGDLRRRHGAESVAFSTTTPTGTGLADSIEWIDRFIRTFGSPNKIAAVELCDFHREFSHRFTFGAGNPFPDFSRSELILLWGSNPTSTWLNMAQQVADARARGAKLVVVDPRAVGFADQADLWLRIRPGADGILAMGIARLLIENGAQNDSFVREWSNAPLLVRDDTGNFLRSEECGLQPGGYVVWREDVAAPYPYDPTSRRMPYPERLALRGPLEVKTPSGPLSCRPAFERYREALEPYSVDHVADCTWLEPDDIVAFARLLADHAAVSYYCWTGTSQHANATQSDRAIASLMALKGCYDSHGGNRLVAKPPREDVGDLALLPAGQLEKTLGADELPLGPPRFGMITAHHFYRAVLEGNPYRVRGLMGFGANLLLAYPDARRGAEALRELDFYVHCDLMENPTARFADIVLPVNTLWEREGLRVGFEADQKAETRVQLRQRIIAPRGEARSDAEICFALAQRLGHGAAFFDGDFDAALDHVMAPSGITVARLRAEPSGVTIPLDNEPQAYRSATSQGVRGFATQTGLVELYSELLHRHGYPPVPVFEPNELAGGARNAEFPLALTTSKSGYFCHSQHRGIPSLRQSEPDPTVEIAPSTFDDLGLERGEWVSIETMSGGVRMRAQVNPKLHPSVVRAAYGWWQSNPRLGLPGFDPLSADGSNYNLLIDGGRLDPLSGTPSLRSTSCRIVPVINGPRHSWRGFVDATVLALTPISDGVREVLIGRYDRRPLPDYKPGQHITLSVSQGDVSVTRCYSLTGTAVAEDREHYSIAVRLVEKTASRPQGAMSGAVHATLRVGDGVRLKAPGGDFHIPLESERPIVLVAGGVGITPFISYLETLATLPATPRVHLVYANRNAAARCFSEKLTELQRVLPRLSRTDIFSQPLPTDRVGVNFDKLGRVETGDILRSNFSGDPIVFQCASPAMMAAVRQNLLARGMNDADIIEEAFAPPVVDLDKVPPGPFRVVFAQSGREAVWTPEKGSLLDLAESIGLKLRSGCRVGQCESCVAKVLAGRTCYAAKLNYADADSCLMCQALPAGEVTLDC
jgi:anaerobic selenocysteine-containing dehydrogenase/ferredoxin-NADP reductase